MPNLMDQLILLRLTCNGDPVSVGTSVLYSFTLEQGIIVLRTRRSIYLLVRSKNSYPELGVVYLCYGSVLHPR